MSSIRPHPYLIPLAALAFAAAFVAFEHFNGGVRTHHFLARADLPGFSNWFSLLILPVLGALVAVRARSLRVGQVGGTPSSKLVAAAAASVAYGGALAASFHLGFGQVSVFLFGSLLLLAVVFPVYRVEYIFGFVLGMTITFGSGIPLTFALVFASILFLLRRGAVLVWSSIRKWRA